MRENAAKVRHWAALSGNDWDLAAMVRIEWQMIGQHVASEGCQKMRENAAKVRHWVANDWAACGIRGVPKNVGKCGKSAALSGNDWDLVAMVGIEWQMIGQHVASEGCQRMWENVEKCGIEQYWVAMIGIEWQMIGQHVASEKCKRIWENADKCAIEQQWLALSGNQVCTRVRNKVTE
jgi:hypothetical protein